MGVRDPRDITEHLKRKDVQERIQKNMLEARSKATVTISRAAKLFSFTESQLREWEKRGLLQTERPSLEGKSSTGHRQYAPAELDKLAIIRELIRGGYGPSEIPPDVDTLWQRIVGEQGLALPSSMTDGLPATPQTERIPLDKRVESTEQREFWRYFVSQALRLSLMLLCEDIPDTVAGLIIPLQQKQFAHSVRTPFDLPQVGLSLVGWLEANRSFYTFLDDSPEFEFASDFRIEPLWAYDMHPIKGDVVQDNTLIFVQRKARALPLNQTLVETIRRLLELVYRHQAAWRPAFDYGRHDWMYQVTDFESSPTATDAVLNALADRIVELGGKTPDGRNRWNYCSILLPTETISPLQQRSLVVRARSQHSPHKPGVDGVTVLPGQPIDSLSLKAFQSGHIINLPETAAGETMIAYRAQQKPTHSAMAIPVTGEDALSVAVIYIVANERRAFSKEDERVLRLMSRMIEEQLLTYRARSQTTGKLQDMINNPTLVDTSFRGFFSESDFIRDLEILFSDIFAHDLTGEQAEQDASFIAIDVDDQSTFALKYGDPIVRNLIRAMGLRIQGHLRRLEKLEGRRLYHVSADRFFLMLVGMTLEEARNQAAALKGTLDGDYRIDAQHVDAYIVSPGRPVLPVNLLELQNITVRLGVLSYKIGKLKELFGRYPAETAVIDVRALIMRDLNQALDQGQSASGNCIISWDPDKRGYKVWTPS